MELFIVCPKITCLSKVISMEKSIHGSLLVKKTRCADGCVCTWSSQPTFSRIGAGNLLLSATILFSGNTYIGRRMHDLADDLHMPIIGETQFFNIQKILIPSCQ